MKRTTRFMGLVITTVLFLAGCGGSADPQEISGTASAGQPISGKVYAKDSAGTGAGPVAISPEGRFSIPAGGLTPPFVLKAEGYANGKPVTLYSAGTSAGTVNINPMTDLALHAAAGTGSVEALWSSPASHGDMVSGTALGTATDSARKLLLPFLTAHGAATANPFSDRIRLGAGLDAVFDRIAIKRDSATGELTVSSLVNGATLATMTAAQIGTTALALAGHPPLGAGNPVYLSWYGPSSMDFGMGYDYVSQNIAGSCVSFDDTSKIQGIGSVATKYSIELLEDASSVTEQLGVSASAKIRMGLYSGSAKANFSSESVKDSTSVFVAVYSEVTGYTYHLQNAKLLDGSNGTTNWKDKFKNDVATFRNTCGDRFLKSITTGGKMVGIMKIATSSDKEKTSVTANVKAKSALFNSGAASFSSTMSSMMQQYQASITMFEMGPAETSTPTSFDSFMNAVAAFPIKVNACLSDWHKCAYIVSFVDYATIADGNTNIGTQAAAMGVLIDYDTQYERLLAQITDMQARPQLYEPTSVNLIDLSSRITASKKLVLQAATTCTDNSSACTAPGGLLDPNGVALPARKLLIPATCADYKTNYASVSADGEYRMYFETDAELKNPFYLYCLGMSTATPKEYLTLKLTSPPSTSPSYNFASSLGHGDAYTVFTKVGVVVNPSELAIVRNDFQYSTTTWVWNGCPADTSCDPKVPFGQAKTVYAWSDTNAATQGRANLDFTGTPFAISDPTEWQVTGQGLEFTNWHTDACNDSRPNCKNPIVITNDRKSVNLYAAGKPGYNQPKADVRLKWSE